MTDIHGHRWPQVGTSLRVAALALALVTLMFILLLFPSRSASAETPPKADYRFQDTRSTSVGSAPALTDIGPGTNTFTTATVDDAPRKVLSFPEGNGVKLSPTTDVVPGVGGTYTMVVLFELDSVSGFRRIIDFKNGGSDNGLYVQDSNLSFYRHPQAIVQGAGAPIAANTYVQVALTRDSGGTVVGYVDGVQQFSFFDGLSDGNGFQAIIDANQTLRFFRDNESDGATDEHSAGSVARIRLYDRALTATEVGVLDRLEPTTFVVNSALDGSDIEVRDGKCSTSASNQCTLRAAIQQANSTAGKDTINFDIPTEINGSPNARCDQTTKVCTITTSTMFPAITEAVTIDGYTQGDGTPSTTADDATENTLASGTNAVLKIELSGMGSGTGAIGVNIAASDVMVRGLVINRWAQGVRIYHPSSSVLFRNITIEGNFIGTDPSGIIDLGSFYGVTLESSRFSTVGGTTAASRNLISGNDTGVKIPGGTSNTIEGNLIGTDASGTAPLGNGTGVYIQSPNNVIGGTTAGARNVIAGNSNRGVYLQFDSSVGNRILGNSIFDNGGLGIDLGGGTENASGVTDNDAGDADTGPNGLLNHPVLTSATTSGGQTTIEGFLDKTNSHFINLQFFASPAADPSGFGEGKTFLGEKTNVLGDPDARVIFSFTPATSLAPGQVVTAIATDTFSNDTSEFSNAVVAKDDIPPPAPSTPDLKADSDTGSSSTDNLTKDTTPTFTGTAEAGSTVRILVDGVQQGTDTDTSDGTYSITTSTLTTSPHSVTATATDAAENTSPSSAALTVIIDTRKPIVRSVTSPTTATGNLTATFSERMDTTTINGTSATPSKSFKLYRLVKQSDGTIKKVAVSASVGCTNITTTSGTIVSRATLDPTNNLTNGNYEAQVTPAAKDRAGNALDQNPTTPTTNDPKSWRFTI